MMFWIKERTPQNVPTVFNRENVIPFVISYRQEIVQIWRDVYTFDQIDRYLGQCEALWTWYLIPCSDLPGSM